MENWDVLIDLYLYSYICFYISFGAWGKRGGAVLGEGERTLWCHRIAFGVRRYKGCVRIGTLDDARHLKDLSLGRASQKLWSDASPSRLLPLFGNICSSHSHTTGSSQNLCHLSFQWLTVARRSTFASCLHLRNPFAYVWMGGWQKYNATAWSHISVRRLVLKSAERRNTEQCWRHWNKERKQMMSAETEDWVSSGSKHYLVSSN